MSPPAPEDAPRAGAGESSVAVLLTWFVPGAGHLYLGRPAFALAAFVLVEGLYIVGLKLSGGMGFEMLAEELRGPLSPALSPEAANLGAYLWHMNEYGFGLPFPRPWPEWINLGVTLTAASGVLNACLMAQAHVDARLPRGQSAGRRSPAFFALLTWLVPGLGHLAQGRKARAAIVFLALVALLVLGTVLAEGSNLSRERHFYYWGGQFMAGLPAVVLEAAHGHQRVGGRIPYVEAGLVIGSIAGMLNIMAMLDVFGRAEARLFGRAEKDAAEGAKAGAP